jgi:hypothetical protein
MLETALANNPKKGDTQFLEIRDVRLFNNN